MRFGAWNVKNLYRAGSITTTACELERYKLDLVGVQEVRWDNGGNERAGIIIYSMERKRKSSIGNWKFCTPQNSVSS